MRFSAPVTALGALFWLATPITADEGYAINPQLRQPVNLPTWLNGKLFHVHELAGGAGDSVLRTARSWTSPNPAWLPPGVNFNRELKMEEVRWQRDPAEVVRDALVESFASAGSLAEDEASADYSLSVILYRFGLAEATWREYYSKLEMLVQIKNLRTGVITDVAAIGTCVANIEDRKHKSVQAIQSGLETALSRGLANFLYNTRTKSAME